ncbi:MAG: hypothetical protein U1F43_29000 [Myxococcota bacterium]
MSTDTHVLLTVRGTLAPQSLEAARALHNDTAGSPAGIAAAREHGDLSHKVYAPCARWSRAGDQAGQLLFIDAWVEPEGIGRFFGNAHVRQQAAGMFSERDATVWMPARGAFAWTLQAPRGRDERYVGMIRAPIAAPEQAIATFAAVDRAIQRDARRRGLIAHELYIKLPMPGASGPMEILGLDLWHDFDGMSEQYADRSKMEALGAAFAGAPQASVWEQATGNWSEW